MPSESTQQTIEYRPSLVGRLARFGIPVLHRVLPAGVYKVVYDALYINYKRFLHLSYGGRVLAANAFGSKDRKMKTTLTWRLLPYTMGGRKALENAFDVTARAEREGIDGALVECGVAQGGTAAMMAMTNRMIGRTARPKWFFDSYEGLPEPTAEDYEGGRTGEFIRPLGKGECLGTIEQVSKLLFDTLELPREDVTLVKGWFQDTVPVHRDRVGPIAVLRLDGDWYESTKVPLDSFCDRITPGGFIIVDDYATCFGSRKAVDEFRHERNITTPLHPDGRGGVWFVMPERA